jgi:hypothetical protein
VPYRDSELQRAAKAEWARRNRCVEPQRRTRNGVPLLPMEFRLKHVADVLALLEGQVVAVLGDQKLGTIERARTIGYLAAIGLRGLETGEIVARVEALELVLKLRKQYVK